MTGCCHTHSLFSVELVTESSFLGLTKSVGSQQGSAEARASRDWVLSETRLRDFFSGGDVIELLYRLSNEHLRVVHS